MDVLVLTRKLLYLFQDINNIRAELNKATMGFDVRKAAELNIDNLIKGKSSDEEVCTPQDLCVH